MLERKFKKWVVTCAVSGAIAVALTGCAGKKDVKSDDKAAVETTDKETEGQDSNVSAATDQKEDAAETSDMTEVQSDIGKQLEAYYEQQLLKEEGLIELPCGYELGIKERHLDGYTVGEAYLEEYGICYHAVWDYDKDGQDELLVLVLDENEDDERSRMYARMYEVVDGQVKETAELKSLMSWMECDMNQSMEIFLRETKDWFYLAEEDRGASGIYADGVTYAIRVAHYDGSDFVVDLAKQMTGSDFSETDEEVADTARLLRNVTFDRTADDLTYEYHFNTKDNLLSVFYMTAEIGGSLDKYYQTMNITDVPAYMVRLYAKREE